MKAIFLIVPVILFVMACSYSKSKDEIKKEIYQTEKDFEQMAAEKGIAEAFYFFAAENAVIRRGNDSLISGKDNIKRYYEKKDSIHAIVTWTPDFIDVSDCGNLGYTFGNACWKIPGPNGDTTEYKGTFHTVWKRQSDKKWKYVWD